MRIIHQGPRASSPDSQAEYTQAIRPRFCLLLENALQFGGSPYTGLDVLTTPSTTLARNRTGDLSRRCTLHALATPARGRFELERNNSIALDGAAQEDQ